MHLVETYSRTTGLRISKMELFEKFFPIGFEEDYVVIVTGTGAGGNTYSHYGLVTRFLREKIRAAGLKIIQLGGPKDERIDSDLDLCGQTDLAQYFWIMKHAKLLISSDTSAAHLAGHYGIKLVTAFGMTHPSTCGAFFGKAEDRIFVLPEYKHGRASYAPDESPKMIDTIYPEKIANAACELMGWEPVPNKTIYIGDGYKSPAIIWIPDFIMGPNMFPENTLNARLDLGGNEDMLAGQARIRRLTIFTDKPFDLTKITPFRGNIERIVYILDKNQTPDFAAKVRLAGLPLHLVSYADEETINGWKLDYTDLGVIERRAKPPVVKCSPGSEFLTSRIYFSNGKGYLSLAHKEADKQLDNFGNLSDTVIDNPLFWEDSEFYYIYHV